MCSIVHYFASDVNRQNLRFREVPPAGFILHPSSFILHPSSFILHLSSFILHPSSFILHPSSFILHPSSFIFHPSSFILHPFLTSSLRRQRMIRRQVIARPDFFPSGLFSGCIPERIDQREAERKQGNTAKIETPRGNIM